MTDALLACDVMNPCPAFCSPEDNARDARDVIREGRLETLPVVGQDGKVQGVLEDHMVIRYVNRRVLELRERETRLECAR
jgi:CBS domain-containing protein